MLPKFLEQVLHLTQAEAPYCRRRRRGGEKEIGVHFKHHRTLLVARYCKSSEQRITS